MPEESPVMAAEPAVTYDSTATTYASVVSGPTLDVEGKHDRKSEWDRQ